MWGDSEGPVCCGKVATLARNSPQLKMRASNNDRSSAEHEKCAVPNQSDSTLGSLFNRVNGASGLSAPCLAARELPGSGDLGRLRSKPKRLDQHSSSMQDRYLLQVLGCGTWYLARCCTVHRGGEH